MLMGYVAYKLRSVSLVRSMVYSALAGLMSIFMLNNDAILMGTGLAVVGVLFGLARILMENQGDKEL